MRRRRLGAAPRAVLEPLRAIAEAGQAGGALDRNARLVVDALTKSSLGKFEVISQEVVGPVIGADLQRKGIYATLASIVGWFTCRLAQAGRDWCTAPPKYS